LGMGMEVHVLDIVDIIAPYDNRLARSSTERQCSPLVCSPVQRTDPPVDQYSPKSIPARTRPRALAPAPLQGDKSASPAVPLYWRG